MVMDPMLFVLFPWSFQMAKKQFQKLNICEFGCLTSFSFRLQLYNNTQQTTLFIAQLALNAHCSAQSRSVLLPVLKLRIG